MRRDVPAQVLLRLQKPHPQPKESGGSAVAPAALTGPHLKTQEGKSVRSNMLKQHLMQVTTDSEESGSSMLAA